MRTIAGEFIQHVQSDLIFPLELQEHVGNGNNFWCLDWWVIEIAKYFFEGEQEYRRYPRARRLLGNDSLDRDEMVRLGRQRQETMNEIAGENVLVFENCRGFNTLLISTLKGVEKIYALVESDFPVVVDKTREYLKRFDNVEIVSSSDSMVGAVTWMKTDSFLQSVKGGEK